MNKKFLSLVLALVMVLGTFTSVFAADAKKDEVKEVPKLTSTDAKIQWLVDNKYVEGRKLNEDPKDNDLALDKNIRRSEVTKLLVYAIGKADLADKLQGAMVPYTDVKADHWANGFITVGTTSPSEKNGLPFLQGYPTGEFKPMKDVTVAELAKMLVVLADKNLTAAKVEMANKNWPAQWLTMAHDLGIMDGVKNVNANDAAHRTVAFEMIYNAFYIIKDLRVLPANETMGIISKQTRDMKLVLNQGDMKKEFTVDKNTVFVESKATIAKAWLGINLVGNDYYVGSLVRVLTDKDGVVTHIIQLGNPSELALDNTGWKGVADHHVEGNAVSPDRFETIQFNDSNKTVVYTNNKTRYFVADVAKNELTEVKDRDAVLKLLDNNSEAKRVYAGYDVMPESKRNEATVVVFNEVYVDNNEIVRVVTPGDTTFKLMVEMPGYSQTEKVALSTRMNDKVFPFNYNVEKYDVFKTTIKDNDYVEGRPVSLLIDHSEANIYKVTEVNHKEVDGLQATPQKRIDTIELTDGKGKETFDVMIDADNFFTDEVKVGAMVQVHYKDNNAAGKLLDIVSVVPDTEYRGELPNGKDNRQVKAVIESEPIAIPGSQYFTVTVREIIDGKPSKYTSNFVTKLNDKNDLEVGAEYTFIADLAKFENHAYPYASNFDKSDAQKELEAAAITITHTSPTRQGKVYAAYNKNYGGTLGEEKANFIDVPFAIDKDAKEIEVTAKAGNAEIKLIPATKSKGLEAGNKVYHVAYTLAGDNTADDLDYFFETLKTDGGTVKIKVIDKLGNEAKNQADFEALEIVSYPGQNVVK